VMAGRLEGRVALVTGAAGGIGLAIAQRYSAEGARVCLADIAGEQAKIQAEKIGAPAFSVSYNAGTLESIAEMVQQVTRQAGGIDILVNNAAVVEIGPFLEITEESYDRVFNVNVKGLLFTLQAVARTMIEKGNGGKIINLASQAGRRGDPLVTVYGASKAAVISITQSAALALIPHRINVNGIAPGVVDTPMWERVDSLYAKHQGLPLGEKKKRVGAAVPYGRMGVPEDHVGAAVFLASSDSDYVVAQTLGVDGGNWMA
jgi:NAD(P)-dependent dehydrogenase (short-subunit alcohol dehydrogenase family)